jgi:prepilin-type N-terminal cleavage/methylation domain-containing protein
VQKGLTLLEVVITMTLLSMLSVIALEAFRLGSRSWEKQQRQVETEQRIRVVYELLAQEMASVKAVTTLVDGKKVVAFQGWPDRVLFHSAPDPYREFPYNGMIRNLSVFVERDRGLLVQESYPLVEGMVSLTSTGKIRIVDPQVTGIEFRYLSLSEDQGDNFHWGERWDPLELSKRRRSRRSRAGKISSLPLAVEVTLTITEKRGEQEFTFLLPIHVGRRL